MDIQFQPFVQSSWAYYCYKPKPMAILTNISSQSVYSVNFLEFRIEFDKMLKENYLIITSLRKSSSSTDSVWLHASRLWTLCGRELWPKSYFATKHTQKKNKSFNFDDSVGVYKISQSILSFLLTIFYAFTGANVFDRIRWRTQSTVWCWSNFPLLLPFSLIFNWFIRLTYVLIILLLH